MKYLNRLFSLIYLSLFLSLLTVAVQADEEEYSEDELERHSHVCEDPLREFISCQSTGCIKTCANPNPIQCTLDCSHGCFCRDGFVLDETTDRCVQVQECTTLCRENEEYRECDRCEPTCRDARPACPPGCAAPGKGSCLCKRNYVRNSIGQCIRRERCA